MTKWSVGEDQVLREYSAQEALDLLSGRTLHAIHARRKVLGLVARKKGNWTRREDRILKAHNLEPLQKIARLLKNERSLSAIKYRRTLICPTKRTKNWTGAETKRFRVLWPSLSRRELLSAFPNRTWPALDFKARSLGVYKSKPHHVLGNNFIDEIRQRAKEDRISLQQVCLQSGIGAWFLFAKRTGNKVDLNKIEKCVRFFGGRFLIDWQDE